jgi:hypothetical protein
LGAIFECALTDGINSVSRQIDDPGFNAKMPKSM